MTEVDVTREIRRAVDTGKVVFGVRQTEKSILEGKAKLIVTAKNAPLAQKEKILHKAGLSEVHIIEANESGLELGSVCGKPFSVSVMAVEDTGKSSLKALMNKK